MGLANYARCSHKTREMQTTPGSNSASPQYNKILLCYHIENAIVQACSPKAQEPWYPQCDRRRGGSVTHLHSVVLLLLVLLCKPSNMAITWLMHAIHYTGLVFNRMSILTPMPLYTILLDHAMLFRAWYFHKAPKRELAFHIWSIDSCLMKRSNTDLWCEVCKFSFHLIQLSSKGNNLLMLVCFNLPTKT